MPEKLELVDHDPLGRTSARCGGDSDHAARTSAADACCRHCLHGWMLARLEQEGVSAKDKRSRSRDRSRPEELLVPPPTRMHPFEACDVAAAADNVAPSPCVCVQGSCFGRLVHCADCCSGERASAEAAARCGGRAGGRSEACGWEYARAGSTMSSIVKHGWYAPLLHASAYQRSGHAERNGGVPERARRRQRVLYGRKHHRRFTERRESEKSKLQQRPQRHGMALLSHRGYARHSVACADCAYADCLCKSKKTESVPSRKKSFTFTGSARSRNAMEHTAEPIRLLTEPWDSAGGRRGYPTGAQSADCGRRTRALGSRVRAVVPLVVGELVLALGARLQHAYPCSA